MNKEKFVKRVHETVEGYRKGRNAYERIRASINCLQYELLIDTKYKNAVYMRIDRGGESGTFGSLEIIDYSITVIDRSFKKTNVDYGMYVCNRKTGKPNNGHVRFDLHRLEKGILYYRHVTYKRGKYISEEKALVLKTTKLNHEMI